MRVGKSKMEEIEDEKKKRKRNIKLIKAYSFVYYYISAAASWYWNAVYEMWRAYQIKNNLIFK